LHYAIMALYVHDEEQGNKYETFRTYNWSIKKLRWD
jgi:hypothetical protein